MSRRSGRNVKAIVERPFGFNRDIFSEDGSSDEDSIKHNKHSSSGDSITEDLENGASDSTGSSDEDDRSRRKNSKSSSEHGLKKAVELKHKDGKVHSIKDSHSKDGKGHSTKDGHNKDAKGNSTKDGHIIDGKSHSSKDGHSKDGKSHSTKDDHSKDGKVHSIKDGHSKDGKGHSTKDDHSKDGKSRSPKDDHSKDGKVHSIKDGHSKDGKSHSPKDDHSKDGKSHSPKDGHSKDGKSHSTKDGHSKDRNSHSTKDGHSKSQGKSSHKVADKGLRRSSRLQQETSFFDHRQTESQEQLKAKTMYSDVFSDEESASESSSSSNNFSDDERGQKKPKTKTKKQNTSEKVTSKKPTETKVQKVRHLSSSTEDEEEEEIESGSGSESEWTSSSVEKGQTKSSKRSDDKKRSSRRQVTQLNINYKEESDNGTDTDDLIELSEPENEDVGSSETIEKVMKSRTARVGASGSKTTIYNVENDGDPNTNLDLENDEVEQQYLIKWKNWSHMHNTWESETTLAEMKVNGLKKLKNFKDREEIRLYWRLAATPEEIEYQHCQDELTDELYLQYCEAERVVIEFPPKSEGESFDYLVKWQGLPYSECTREDNRLIQKRFPEIVEQYNERLKSEAIPNRHCRALKSRPSFHRLQKQPDYIGGPKKLQLRDYQLKGLNWLLHSWCKENGAILADEMGLGKTIQTISFLSVLMSVHQVYGPFLLIVPLSTVVTWQREFQVWAPQINVTVYIGDINTRNMIREYEWYEGDSKKFKCNVVITTYEIVLKDKLPLSEINWAVLGVDEAHRLKNDDSMLYKSLIDFNTNHRLFITGTPLQNSLRELWSLLHFINPKHFEEWEEFEQKHSSADKTGFRYLHKELEPYLLRRVKKDVEKSLPAKVEQILHVEMSRSQRQCYRYILTRNYEALAKGTKGNISGFVNLMMELKKCCNHTSLVIDDYETEDPLEMIVKGSGKLLLLDKLLPRLKESGHRVLIFSQMVRLLDIIANYLKLKGYLFQRLDGTIGSERRKQAMDHFNAEGSQDFCFLLSTRAGGLGVNLVTADTVIIFDSDWNPQNDLQAMARAHRIGQKNQVSVYRLVTKNSMEEEIIERAKKKMVLDHLVIQRMDTSGRTVLDRSGFNGQSSRNPFSKEDLNSILKFGAEELFKESDDEDAQVDIDDILKRAETRNTEDFKHSATDELLSNFKIVKFDNLEEEEESQPKRHITKGWDEIIPEAERQKIEEEKRKLQEAEMQLAPRSRRNLRESSDSDFEDGKRKKNKMQRKESDEEEEEDEDETEDEEDDRQTRKRGKPREAVKGFTDVELRRFIKSFKKFAHPKKRVADVAEDAELQEKSEADLQHLADLILTNCDHTMKEFEEKQKEEAEASPTADGNNGKKSRARPSFRLGTVTINARSILDSIQELEPLAKLMEPSSKEKICLGENVKKVHRFDCHWTVDDDRNLLTGIYTCGMGNWEAIKMDSELKLSHKILLDDGLKPQARHLQSRADYLLKVLHEQTAEKIKEKVKSGKGTESGKRKRKHHNDADSHGKHSHSKKHKSDKEKRDDRPHKKNKEEDSKGKARAPLHFTTKDTVAANLSNSLLPKEDYEKCVEMMKPVNKSLLLMGDVISSASTDKSQLVDAILLIGNQISTLLTEYKNPTDIKEWRNNLWQYVTLFASSTYGIKRLKDLYRFAHDKQENEENRKLQEQTRVEESTLHYGNHPNNANRYDQNHWQHQKRLNTADFRSDSFRKRTRDDYTQIRSFRPSRVNSEDQAAQQNTDSMSKLSPSSSNQAPISSQPASFRYRKDAAMGQQRNRDQCYPCPPSDVPLHPYYGRDVPQSAPLPPLPPLPPPSSVNFNSPLDAQHYPQPTWYGDSSSDNYSRPLPPPPHSQSQYGYSRDRKTFMSNQYPNEASSKQGQRRRQDSRFSGHNRQQPYAYQQYNRRDNRRSSYRDRDSDRHFGQTVPSSDRSGDSQDPGVLDLQTTVESATTSPPKDFSQPHDIPVSSQFSSVPSVSSGVATTSPVQSITSHTSPAAFPQDNH